MARPSAVVLLTVLALSLSAQAPPQGRVERRQGQAGRGAPPPKGGEAAAWGPDPSDLPVGGRRGRRSRPHDLCVAQCIDCHGTAGARRRQGREPDSLGGRAARSLRQRARAVPEEGTQVARPASTALTDDADRDLAHFLRQRVNDYAARLADLPGGERPDRRCRRRAPPSSTARASAATCHGATSSLAGIGGRLEPVDMQQRFLFPRTRPRPRRRRRARRRAPLP